jgi:hypothetical protein
MEERKVYDYLIEVYVSDTARTFNVLGTHLDIGEAHLIVIDNQDVVFMTTERFSILNKGVYNG